MASYTRDAGLQRLAFSPPPCGYSIGQCECIHTSNGNVVATRLFTPTNTGGLCETKQRWIARQNYEDTRLLCIFSHGNSDDIQTSTVYIQWLCDRFNMNVLAYDYMGYGQSTAGITTEHNMCEYIDTVYDLAVRMQVSAQKLLIMGKSIGSGPAVYLASTRRSTCALILVSPLASGVRVVCDTTNMPRAVVEAMDAWFMPSVERISNVRAPTLVVHGLLDEVISVDNATALVARCRGNAAYSPLYVSAGHNDIESLFAEQFVMHITRFLSYVSGVTATPHDHEATNRHYD